MPGAVIEYSPKKRENEISTTTDMINFLNNTQTYGRGLEDRWSGLARLRGQKSVTHNFGRNTI
jgi:hypothetical protein